MIICIKVYVYLQPFVIVDETTENGQFRGFPHLNTAFVCFLFKTSGSSRVLIYRYVKYQVQRTHDCFL